MVGDVITVSCLAENSNHSADVNIVINGHTPQGTNTQTLKVENGGWNTLTNFTYEVQPMDTELPVTCYVLNQALGSNKTDTKVISILKTPQATAMAPTTLLPTEVSPTSEVEVIVTPPSVPATTMQPREVGVTTTTTSAPITASAAPLPPSVLPTVIQTTQKPTPTEDQASTEAVVPAEIPTTKPTTSTMTTTTTTFRPIITATSAVQPPVSNKAGTHLALTMFFLVIVTGLSFGVVWYIRRRRRLEQLRHQLMPQYNFDPTDDQDDWENQLIDEESSLRPRDKVQLYSYQRQH
ncbi:unnamed protein product [Meganyctiphanes norvegica]|uniref:Ig-like domain-containing protein n=1 Tax=Meganyctiphanes norvegica TaxID=48144 RepID=A0AAV2RP02_MEGNR